MEGLDDPGQIVARRQLVIDNQLQFREKALKSPIGLRLIIRGTCALLSAAGARQRGAQCGERSTPCYAG